MPNTTNHLGNTNKHPLHQQSNDKMKSIENAEGIESLFLRCQCEWHSYSTKQCGTGSKHRITIRATIFTFDTHPQRSEVSDWLLYTMHITCLFRV